MNDGWAVEVRDPVYYNPINTQRLRLVPASYSHQDRGGPMEATVDVGGDLLACWDVLNWLRYWVVIRNPNGTPVWWGLVQRAEVRTGKTTVGVSLDDMRNRILVDYTYEDASGTPQDGTTSWAQDAVSVARYGKKEERVSYADAKDATEAQQKRDIWLDQVKVPVAALEVGEGEVGATLRCTGVWQTVDWVYYANPLGKEVYDESDDVEHLLGWGLTSNVIGFRQQAIHDRECRLQNLIYGGKVVVTGSASNNGTYTVQQPGEEDQVTLTSTAISFEPNDDIRTTNLGELYPFRGEDMIQVSGSSANNNGYYWVKTTGANAIEVSSGANTIQSMSAGPSITLVQGHRVTLEENVTVERPGNNVTLTALGTKIAQSFQNTQATAWAVYEVAVRVKRIGTCADYLQVSIYSGATPTTQLATATVQGITFAEEMSWVTINLGTPATINPGNTYWIVLERTGGNAPDNCYAVGLNTEAGYGYGALKIWNGSAWVDRWENADMPFQVWGQVETSTQISTMLTAAGQFLTGVAVMDASATWKRQWRDGQRRALAEVEELMDTGAASGRRFVSTVTPERMAIVRLEPQPASDDPLFSATTGELRMPTGGPWDVGVLPVGRWVRLNDVPPLLGSTVAGVSAIFVERADYDVAAGRLQLEPRGRRQPWEL